MKKERWAYEAVSQGCHMGVTGCHNGVHPCDTCDIVTSVTSKGNEERKVQSDGSPFEPVGPLQTLQHITHGKKILNFLPSPLDKGLLMLYICTHISTLNEGTRRLQPSYILIHYIYLYIYISIYIDSHRYIH